MPERVAKYEIIEPLGSGAAGVLYRALDTRLKRLVALKVIAPAPEVTEEARARLLAEAQAWSAWTASGIVTVYDIGEEGGRSFIAMELPDGPSLRHVLDERIEFCLEEKIAIMVQLCRALACAHQRGIIHRDIHPGNIFLPADGPAKIASYGLSIEPCGRNPSAADTTAYLSPEQMEGRADSRSDQYSLAAVFLEWLGSRPALHAGAPATGAPAAGESAAAAPPETARLAELGRILERATNREPAKRFPDLRAIGAQLELVLERCGTTEHAPRAIASWQDRLSFPPDVAPPSRAASRPSAADVSRFLDGQWSRSNIALAALAVFAAVSLGVALLAPFPDQRQRGIAAPANSRTPASRPAAPAFAGAGFTGNAASHAVASADPRAVAAKVATPLDPTGRAAAEGARDRALAARFRSAKSEALGQAPELHLAAQGKEIEADSAYARSDYGLAAVLYDIARDGYELAARRAEMETSALAKANVDAQVAADSRMTSTNADAAPVDGGPKDVTYPDSISRALSAAKQVTRTGPLIVEPPKKQTPNEKPPRSVLAFASVFTQSTDGNRGGGTWGACSRADTASARACAKASCEASRKSDRPCVEVASSQPGEYCAVAKASGVGVSWAACDADRAQAEAAALAGCREQVARHYGDGAATCGITWSNAQH